MKSLFQVLSAVSLLGIFVMCAGCGGGNSSGFSALPEDTSGDGQTLTFGNLITRIAGTVQPPVTAGEAGTVVTGVAGGTVSNLILRDTAGNLAETRIVFVSDRDGDNDIYSMNSDGSDLRQLTNSPGRDEEPAYSPDGSKIAFTSDRRGGLFDLYIMNADGSGVTPITTSPRDERQPSWSPDGTTLVFALGVQIYRMNVNGTNLVDLSNNSFREYNPVWSPDGTKIAFNSTRSGGGVEQEIHTMNADGTGVSGPLTNNTTDDEGPSWSPDGTKIAFASVRDGDWELYTMYANGTGQTRLTSFPDYDFSPRWSPDGSKIVFWHRYQSQNYQLYSVNMDGAINSGLTRLNNTPYNDISPSWSYFSRIKTLIGTGGTLGTTAAGFLFGRRGDLVQSVVAFNATPQTSARILAQTPSGSGLPNVIFTISADSMTSLAFVNGATITATTVVGTGGDKQTATGAIVDFNAATGYVSAILPYTANRAAGSGAPSITTENGVHILRGKFLSAWDGTGKNRASSGASEVRLDARTGNILSLK